MVYDNNERHEKKELNYVTDENQLNVPVLVEAIMVRYMGKILDLVRISDISDRNLVQLSRTIKDDCYEKIKFAKAILKEHGIEDIEGK